MKTICTKQLFHKTLTVESASYDKAIIMLGKKLFIGVYSASVRKVNPILDDSYVITYFDRTGNKIGEVSSVQVKTIY